MEKNKLDRINELARLKKQRALTEAETAEQAVLRQEYIAEWRRSTIELLENAYIVDGEGGKRPLSPKKRS